MYLESLYGDGGETCVSSNPIPNGSVWGTTGEPQPQLSVAPNAVRISPPAHFASRIQNFVTTFLSKATSRDRGEEPPLSGRQPYKPGSCVGAAASYRGGAVRDR